MNRRPVLSVAAVLAVFATLVVLASLEKLEHFEYQRADSAAEAARVQVAFPPTNLRDVGFFGRSCLPGLGTGAGGHSETPKEVVLAELGESYNQMIRALRP